MKKFRITKIQFENKLYRTDSIELVSTNFDKGDNHFTLIIGNNGTGKSRILGNIAKALIENQRSRNLEKLEFSKIEKTSDPKKVISVSNSLYDKFPLDRSFTVGIENNFKEEFYNYLGTRTRMGASSRILIRRAVDILLENYLNKNISECYRLVFNYLDYKPKILLEYKLIFRDLTESENHKITPKDIEKYILKESKYSEMNKNIYKTISEKYSDKFIEVCNFLNQIREKGDRDFQIEIDFSLENINKLTRNITKYKDDLKTYEVLNILRKINMIKAFDVKLIQKEKKIFSFSDTSSGEANILCTLIALIPLVENNSCILIDEPEISLHPSWQYKYIDLLNKIFERFKGCHIIIASHSHFLVSDLETSNSSVVILKKIDDIVTSTLLNESTYGWSAEDILLNVFDMPTTRNFYISNIVSEALELIAKNQKNKLRFKKIKIELKNIEPNLKEQDPLKLIIKTILTV